MKKKEYYLALTAIEEFWDISKCILFLSEGAKRYSRREKWENFEWIVMDDPWEKNKLYKAMEYTEDVYEYMLPIISKILNEIHDINHSNRFWRIIIGPWLEHYIMILYERYFSLKKTIETYCFTTFGLDESSFTVPFNTLDLLELSRTDLYNLQLYTDILEFLNFDVKKKKYEICIKPIQDAKKIIHHKEMIKKLARGIKKVVNNVVKKNKHIIFKQTYFSRFIVYKLFLKLKGRIMLDFEEPVVINNKILDYKKRKEITKKIKNLNTNYLKESEFVRLLISCLEKDIPYCFVESFLELYQNTDHVYTDRIQAIFSATGWYWDESFKIWAAKCAERGTKILISPHSGSGIILKEFDIKHELKICDKYYPWGTDVKCFYNKVPQVSMPATRLTGREVLGINRKSKELLFVTTNRPRYTRALSTSPSQFNEYLNWQIRFINTINDANKLYLKVRLYQEDNGWDMEMRLRDQFNNICIENMNKTPFLKRLKASSIYICDHLGSGYLEALSANKPTILFWNPKNYDLTVESEPYFDKFHEVGILFYTPEEAAKAVNNISNKVEEWWYEPKKQEAVKEFCYYYCRTSPNAINEWAEEFKKILHNTSL